jgi:hypothetical protein
VYERTNVLPWQASWFTGRFLKVIRGASGYRVRVTLLRAGTMSGVFALIPVDC